MTEFEDYYNSSERFSAANIIQNTPNLITVHVEATEDKSFWSYILKPYFNSKLDFLAYSDKKLTTGKKGLRPLFNQTCESLIVCIDSDYDYLFQNAEIQRCGVFQTYAYAPENLKCCAESLHTICTDVTDNPAEKINFVTYLEQYSKIIYPLFIWHLYFFRLSGDDDKSHFYSTVHIPSKFNLSEINSVIFANLENNIQQKMAKLIKEFPQEIDLVNLLSNQLKALGLEEKNTYLFINGHTLHNNVVLPLLRVTCDNLKTDSIKKINQSSADSEHKNKTREDYINRVGNTDDKIKLALSFNKDFKYCFLFQKITTEIENYIATFKQHTQGLNYV